MTAPTLRETVVRAIAGYWAEPDGWTLEEVVIRDIPAVAEKLADAVLAVLTPPTAEQVAEVLNAHALIGGIRDMRKHCTCGWESGERVGIRSHRVHRAEQIAALWPGRSEAEIKAEARKELIEKWQTGGWAEAFGNNYPPTGALPALHYGQAATAWLYAEADRIERGDA